MTLVLTTESNPGASTWTNASALGSSFWGFPVLARQQLSDVPSVRQGTTVSLAQGPTPGSTISFRYSLNGVTYTETWTVTAGPPAANFEVQTNANADQFIKQWANAMADAVVNYGGRYQIGKPATVFPGLGKATIYRQVQEQDSLDDRIFGTVDVASDFKTVDYSQAGGAGYTYSTLIPLFSTDPGYKTFGAGRATVYASEVHVDLSSTSYEVFAWDTINVAWVTNFSLLP